MTLPLAIWTTGSPVPQAEASRGNFFKMISARVDSSWDGEILDISSENAQTQYPDPTSCSGIIVSGSPARIGDQEDWMKRTEEELVRAHEAQIPVLGICFGHQLLGEALGGKVGPNPKGREIGTVPLKFEQSDPLLDSLSAEPICVMTHLDSVLEAPVGTARIRSTALEANAALRFSDSTWGVQFHPEMDAEIIGYYLQARRDAIENEGLNVEDLLRKRTQSSFGAQLIAAFTRFCATGRHGT